MYYLGPMRSLYTTFLSRIIAGFFCVLLFPALGQNTEKDSLYRLIQKMPEDTAKINVYAAYGFILENHDLDSAAYYYKKIKTISDKYNYLIGKLKYASNYSAVLNSMGKIKESEMVNKEAVKLALQTKIPIQIAKAYNNLANVFNYQGNYDSALTYYLKAASVFEKAADGNLYLGTIYLNIGDLFFSLDQHQRSIEYCLKSIKICESTGDTYCLTQSLTIYASALTGLKKYDEALAPFLRAIDIAQKENYTYYELAALLNIGNLYFKRHEYDQAITTFKRAVELSKSLKSQPNLGTSLNGLAMVYDKLRNDKLADLYGSEAMKINEGLGDILSLKQQYKLMAQIKANVGQHEQAYAYAVKYITLNDSLSSTEIKTKVADLERKYETLKKDKQLLENELEIKQQEKNIRQQETWLVISVILVVLLIGGLVLARRNYAQKKKIHEQRLDALQKEQQLIKLQAIVEGQQQERIRIARELHDDVGSGLTTLHFLGSGIQRDLPDNDKASKIIETSSGLLKQMSEIVWSMSTEQDSLAELIYYIREHVGKTLSDMEFDYQFDIPEDIPDLKIGGVQRRNLYLVTREAVHNVVKHAEASRVEIKISFDNGIRIVVSDNGKGLDEERAKGNGLKNMLHRMEEIGGTRNWLTKKPLATEFFLGFDKFI